MLWLRCSLLFAVLTAAACGPDEPSLPGGDGGPGTDAGPSGCEPPRAMCGSVCVNTQTDPTNCGGCGDACEGGAFCSEGTCMRSCPGGSRACGASCVDVSSDRDHCGACDTPCPADRDCRGGSCVCPEGYIMCDDACVDPDTDTSNCGVCGRACGPDEICTAGSCGCARSGREDDCTDAEDNDCDGDVDCEDSDCEGSTRTCDTMCGADTGIETCGGGAWGACEGGGGAEICGDGIDNDCDGSDTRLPDAWEPNDTCDSCAMISGTDPNVFLDASFDSVYDDVDCYRFTASDDFNFGVREFIDITLSDIPSGHDYDLYLYRNLADCRSRTTLASSIESGSTDDSISWGERFAEGDSSTYYIRVTRFRGHMCVADCGSDAGCYHLTVNGLN